jgi:ElaB/YqjD/DUF883 family membrane-anchored ribosome-binding protein
MAPKTEYEMEASGESVVQAVAGVTERAEELAGSIGQTMDSAAQAVQDTLRRPKRSVSDAVKSVTERIQTSTTYLTDHGMVGVVEDVETLIRRHPFQALMIGFSVGYLLSRSRQR